jgi:hypothetical protein
VGVQVSLVHNMWATFFEDEMCTCSSIQRSSSFSSLVPYYVLEPQSLLDPGSSKTWSSPFCCNLIHLSSTSVILTPLPTIDDFLLSNVIDCRLVSNLRRLMHMVALISVVQPFNIHYLMFLSALYTKNHICFVWITLCIIVWSNFS